MKKNKQNEEQQGEYRAQYGKQVLKNLSVRLTNRFGGGWSVDTLEKCRTFFHVYHISATVSRKSVAFIELGDNKQKSATVSRKSSDTLSFTLSWSHYLILMRIDNPDERSFYEIECAKQQWSVRQLQRQVASSLYERLALSKDKAEVDSGV